MLSFADDGLVTLSVDFCWPREEADDSNDLYSTALDIASDLNDWSYSPCFSDRRQFLARNVVRTWHLTPGIRSLDLQTISARFGLDHRSIRSQDAGFRRKFAQLIESSTEPAIMMLRVEQLLNEWTYQGCCRNPDGFLCRILIRAWIFYPDFRHLSMTEMARRWGKPKQSLGRWVADFKRAFPQLRHLQHIRTDQHDD